MADPVPILIKVKGSTAINTVALLDLSTASFADLLEDIYTAIHPRIPSAWFDKVEEYRIKKNEVVVVWANPDKLLPAVTEISDENWRGVLELIRVRRGMDVVQVAIGDASKVE
ncbi:hypothetical protein BJY04DRAFT_222522 [Aspergillus karnatakaensis]|uniref:uncharacterized protein n=1 Tax=Aspergillus karnatakaensis TaxID=1810916 RepID=UPI003CCDFED4